MQLIFKKTADGNISIEIKDGLATIEFDYVEMIKKLLEDNQIEEPVFEGEISNEEQAKVKEMLQKISDSIPEETIEETE